ncbi:DUF3973 domain-containing protein [Paenibacillus sp. GP183]|uniref:DUF3973 domain-containing protein n=1 Tax=Paenibacillus sp. GP183 TaxID=1882751 RepID=UPI00089CF806|nr:protein of unknown function [Paenibacillus sp. GP183]
MVYYCMNCKQLHDNSKPESSIFKTGFHTINKTNYPVGLCDELSKVFKWVGNDYSTIECVQ